MEKRLRIYYFKETDSLDIWFDEPEKEEISEEIPSEEPEEVVALGLPGEEIVETAARTSIPAPPEGTTEPKEEEPLAEVRHPLKTLNEQRLIIREIPGELIEDYY